MNSNARVSPPIKASAELGQAVRRHRKAKGLTQDTVASLSGVSTGFLSDLENGKPTTELGKILQVLQTLGLELHVVPRGHRAGLTTQAK